jgi:hypothetical protein
LRRYGVNTRTPSTGSGDAAGRVAERVTDGLERQLRLAGETVETLRRDWGIWRID